MADTDTISSLLERCERVAKGLKLTEVQVSKRLFSGDGGRIRLLRSGGDLGVRKLPTVLEKLATLESALEQQPCE